jgi:hypothetical protein
MPKVEIFTGKSHVEPFIINFKEKGLFDFNISIRKIEGITDGIPLVYTLRDSLGTISSRFEYNDANESNIKILVLFNSEEKEASTNNEDFPPPYNYFRIWPVDRKKSIILKWKNANPHIVQFHSEENFTNEAFVENGILFINAVMG